MLILAYQLYLTILNLWGRNHVSEMAETMSCYFLYWSLLYQVSALGR